MGLLVPARRRGREILDAPDVPPADRLRSIRDVTRSNVLFGGRRAALCAVDPWITPTTPVLIVDVGTGLADIPAAIGMLARRRGATVVRIGVDDALDLLLAARERVDAAVCASVRALPFADRSVDVVLCSQLLHHFASDELSAVLGELNRVAIRGVVIADLRRSWVAGAGFWLASFFLGFHPITRHDGVVSVLRGFTATELADRIAQATGVRPLVTRRLGFRLTASWRPRESA